MPRIDKVWGYEDILVDQPEYCAKLLHIAPGMQCSLHYHPVKKETFVVQYGVIRLETRDAENCKENVFLAAGESRTILPGTPHRFSSIRGGIMLEVSTHHSDDDVVRLEPSGEIEFQKAIVG